MSTYTEWGIRNFGRYSKAVAYVEVTDKNEDIHVGTAFHVGNGVFVTARHVVENKTITSIGIDLGIDAFKSERVGLGGPRVIQLNISSGPFLHQNPAVDIACFTVDNPPGEELPLGAHQDVFLNGHELLLHRILVLGYPPIPLTNQTHLIACLGEINALIETRNSEHPSFIISATSRGGFSGAPVLVAYDEENTITGTAVLGVVTESLIHKSEKAEESGYMAVTSVDPIYDCLNQHRLLPDSQKLEF